MAAGDVALKAGLRPHKALYDVKMVTNKSASQFVNLTGKMYYDWKPSCDAWVSNHKFNLVYEYADSPAMRITSNFSTYESFDGKTMNFVSQRKRDGHLFEELRGSAEIGSGSRQEARYTIPEGLVFALPQGTLFPMYHTLNVLKKIKAGEKLYSAVIFDGSDEEGPVQVTSFISSAADSADLVKVSAGMDKGLLRSKAWNIRLAFFPLNKPDSDADYEMSIVFHENGVISSLLIEYRDFSVKQELIALEPLEVKSCGNSVNK